MKKKIIWTIVLIPVVLFLVVIFGSAPFGRKYVNEHGPELLGRKINIEHFSLNIFTGNVSLGDVTIYEANGDSVFATVDDIDLNLSVIDFISGKTHIESLDIDHPVVNVIQKDTTFNFDDLVAFLSEGESSQYTIDDFSLDDGEINYRDVSIPSVPFAYRVHDLEVKIENFNTADHNHITLEGELGEDGKLTATYDGMLSDQNNMGFSLQLEDIDLVGLSPLVVQMFGREVTSGTLSLNTEMTTVNGKISGDNKIVIRDAKVEKVKNLPFTPEYKKVKLKTALYLLTDRDGKCELDVKVTGSKDDPKFSYKRAVMKAVGKSLWKIITSPFYHKKDAPVEEED